MVPVLDSMQEVDAMRAVASALDPLPEESRGRVIAWAASRYGVRVHGGAATGSSGACGGAAESSGSAGSTAIVSSFGTLAEFFDAADPQTDSQKALIGGYWLQKHDGMATFDSGAVNRELKHLGHAIGNITSAFDDLIDQKPALAVQTAKSGKAKQARKKYMITKAGEKFIEQMLGERGNGE